MKRIFTLMAVAGMVSASAQISIQNYDYRLPIQPDTAYLKVVSAGASTLSPGTNASWDLSGVFSGASVDYVLSPYSNPASPMTQGRLAYNVNFNGVVLDSLYNHFGSDADGVYQTAFQMVSISQSLVNVTGDQADSITTLDTIQIIDVPLLKFPLNLGDTWSHTYEVWVPMEITIEQIGWYDAVLSLKQDIIQNDSVVGWGDLTLPTGQTADVLMVRHHSMRIDSTYLDGQPMDPILANQLGFQMGVSSEIDRWAFYTPGLNYAFYEYTEVDGNQSTPVFYRTANISTLENEAATAVLVYPNPAHEKLQIMSDQANDVQLVNMNGSVVRSANKEEWNGNVMVFTVDDLPSGNYFVRMGEETIKVSLN